MNEYAFDSGPVSLNVARGPRGEAPLVLLHGVTRRWQDFTSLLPALCSRWEVFGIDLRGHGRSGRTPGSYRVIDYVDDIVRLLRGTLDQPAILLGHSLGSMVACAVAARAPERVKGLILEDPTFEMTAKRIHETSFADLFRAFKPLAGSHATLPEMVAQLASAEVSVPSQEKKVPLGTVRDAMSLRFSASCLKFMDPDVMTSAIAGQWLDGYDVPETLSAIACPTLMLQGEFNLGGALPDAYADELAAQIRDCVHIRMQRVGHNIHAQQSEYMLQYVLPFLSSLE